MTEADFIIVATAIAAVGIIIVGAIGCEAHWQEKRPPHLVTAVTDENQPSSFHAVEG